VPCGRATWQPCYSLPGVHENAVRGVPTQGVYFDSLSGEVADVTRAGRTRVVFLLGGALLPLVVWLVFRPDLAGPQWSDGPVLQVWLAIEAGIAVLVGIAAPDRSTAVRTVILGWVLQVLHFAVLGEHYDDTLWGLGIFGDVVLAGAAVGLALLARVTSRRDRGRIHT